MGGSLVTLVDRDDVQGLVAFGYGKLTEACYLLAQIQDPSAARAWLKKHHPTTAQHLAAPDKAMQIAFTSQGLLTLELNPQIAGQFSSEFLSGMAGDLNRSRRLGDNGANDPASWLWGAPGTVPDVIVLLFARSGLDAWRSEIEDEDWRQAFHTIACLPTSNMHDHEPFGFRDGISQPDIEWKSERDVSGDSTTYSNILASGEFILGYANEYGKFTDRPLIDAAHDPTNCLPAAVDHPAKKDLGRNGTYLVLRQLEQDVRSFWQYLDRAARELGIRREELGALLVGRSTEGQPLVPGPANNPENGFTYDSDPRGIQCPLGAHIRRANPRTTDLPGHSSCLSGLLRSLGIPRAACRQDLIASTRFHRLLRRGREYGVALPPEEALQPAPTDEQPRGLQFACINANISRQFEFIQNAWLMSRKFNGMTDENDPLLGSGNFSIPQDGALRRILLDMPQFVRVRGGAYFFMPGIRALRFLTREDSV